MSTRALEESMYSVYIDSEVNVDAIIDDQRHILSVANGLRLQGYVEEPVVEVS